LSCLLLLDHCRNCSNFNCSWSLSLFSVVGLRQKCNKLQFLAVVTVSVNGQSSAALYSLITSFFYINNLLQSGVFSTVQWLHSFRDWNSRKTSRAGMVQESRSLFVVYISVSSLLTSSIPRISSSFVRITNWK